VLSWRQLTLNRQAFPPLPARTRARPGLDNLVGVVMSLFLCVQKGLVVDHVNG
jgi:hypothetical protein